MPKKVVETTRRKVTAVDGSPLLDENDEEVSEPRTTVTLECGHTTFASGNAIKKGQMILCPSCDKKYDIAGRTVPPELPRLGKSVEEAKPKRATRKAPAKKAAAETAKAPARTKAKASKAKPKSLAARVKTAAKRIKAKAKAKARAR